MQERQQQKLVPYQFCFRLSHLSSIHIDEYAFEALPPLEPMRKCAMLLFSSSKTQIAIVTTVSHTHSSCVWMPFQRWVSTTFSYTMPRI